MNRSFYAFQLTPTDGQTSSEVVELLKRLGGFSLIRTMDVVMADIPESPQRDVVLFDYEGHGESFRLVDAPGSFGERDDSSEEDEPEEGSADKAPLELTGQDIAAMRDLGVCTAVKVVYPSTERYGAPLYLADERFFEGLVGDAGFPCVTEGLEAEHETHGDDSGELAWFTLSVPADFQFSFES